MKATLDRWPWNTGWKRTFPGDHFVHPTLPELEVSRTDTRAGAGDLARPAETMPSPHPRMNSAKLQFNLSGFPSGNRRGMLGNVPEGRTQTCGGDGIRTGTLELLCEDAGVGTLGSAAGEVAL